MGNNQKLKKMLQQNYNGPFSQSDYELGHFQIYRHKQINKLYGKTTIYLIQKLKFEPKSETKTLCKANMNKTTTTAVHQEKPQTTIFNTTPSIYKSKYKLGNKKKSNLNLNKLGDLQFKSLEALNLFIKQAQPIKIQDLEIFSSHKKVLLYSQGNLKVLDPKIFTCNSSLNHYKQNIKRGYLSPSQIKNLNQNIHQLDNKMKSDIYSIGMLGLQMVTLQPQQNRYQNRDGIWVLERQQQTEKMSNQLIGRQLANAIRILLSQRQQQRPTAYQAIKILESVRINEFENSVQENQKQLINKSYYKYPSQNILLQNENEHLQVKSRLEPKSSRNLNTETVPDTKKPKLKTVPLNKVLKNQLFYNSPNNNTYNSEFLIQPPAPSFQRPIKQFPQTQPLPHKHIQSPSIFKKRQEQKLRSHSAINYKQPSMRMNFPMDRLYDEEGLRLDDRPNKLIELRSIRKDQLISLTKVEQIRTPKIVLSPAKQSRIYFEPKLNNQRIYSKNFENQNQRFYSGIGSYQQVPKFQSLQFEQNKTNPHYIIQQQRRKKQIFQAQQQRRRKYNLAYQQKSRQKEYQQERRRRKQLQAQQQIRKRQEQQVKKQIRKKLQQQQNQKRYQYQTQIYNYNIYQAQQQKKQKQKLILEKQQMNKRMLQQEKLQRRKQNILNFQNQLPNRFNKLSNNSYPYNIKNNLQINRIDRLGIKQGVDNEEYQQLLNNKNISEQNTDKNRKVSIQNYYYIEDQNQINIKKQYQKLPLRSKKYKKTGFVRSISTQEDQEQEENRPKRLTLLINQVKPKPTTPIVEETKEQSNNYIKFPNQENIESNKIQQKKKKKL